MLWEKQIISRGLRKKGNKSKPHYEDIFSFGYLCLVSCIGGLDILESKTFSLNNLEEIFKQQK